jgi:methyl-accepting chemotaxis protein
MSETNTAAAQPATPARSAQGIPPSAPVANESGYEATAELVRLRQMMDTIPINVILATPDGMINYANQQTLKTFVTLERYLPIRADQLVGSSMDVFHKDPRHQRNILADPRNLPHLARIKVGPETLSLNVQAVRDDAGNYVSAMLTWAVITEAVRLEAEIAAQKAFVAAVTRSQAVIEFDLDGNVISANQNFLRVMGYGAGEVEGRHHRTFVDPTYANSREYADFLASLRRGEYFTGEVHRVKKDGSTVWLQVHYNPVTDEHGTLIKYVKTASDVTKQVAARLVLEEVLAGVARNSAALSASSEDLASAGQQMAATAEETSAQATTVAGAAEQVSGNVQTVAAATEEMSASIREIAQNAAEAARVATTAVTVASNANALMGKLDDSSSEIGKVIRVITSIAQQTKLLALNATIEAARAGEAGKGFAVVANEVKELAKETATATEDISQRIETIQSDSRGAVRAIEEIGQIISQINNLQGSIAGAVEEQTATTNEMSRNISEAARGADDIARNIEGVARAASETAVGASRSLDSARGLADMASELQELVSRVE